ncbi:MAG: hypothetical protein JWQ87_3542 [Candidatus Sulfotelmatobacter sp.]|nr:hypothetical protein [Candidatus Sulfotelmatobacter sp.]
MAERPTSFVQQEILAPLGLTKGELIYVDKKISSGVVPLRVTRDSPEAQLRRAERGSGPRRYTIFGCERQRPLSFTTLVGKLKEVFGGACSKWRLLAHVVSEGRRFSIVPAFA